MVYMGQYCSPLGAITIACDEKAITGLWFDNQKYFGSTLSREAAQGEHTLIKEAAMWLDDYFSGNKPNFLPPLCCNSTPFRKEVCNIMLKIPYGETLSYGEIAKEIAKNRGIAKMSAQAVGGAVGHNPIAIMIPCHRVVGSGGNITGYAGGIERKLQLLELEGVNVKKLFIPVKGSAL